MPNAFIRSCIVGIFVVCIIILSGCEEIKEKKQPASKNAPQPKRENVFEEITHIIKLNKCSHYRIYDAKCLKGFDLAPKSEEVNAMYTKVMAKTEKKSKKTKS